MWKSRYIAGFHLGEVRLVLLQIAVRCETPEAGRCRRALADGSAPLHIPIGRIVKESDPTTTPIA